MTFSMAADGYSMMETPGWSTNSWYPYRHNPVPYLVPQFPEPFTGESMGNYPDRMYHQPIQQSGVRSSVIGPNRSPFSEHSEPDANKGPLSQLQELANVFSSPEPCSRNPDNDVKEVSPTESSNAKFSNSTKLEMENTVLNNDSDSGYVTDHPLQKENNSGENEFTTEKVNKTGVSDVLMTETNGESFMESFENNGGESNYINMDDVFLDCNYLSNDKNFESTPNPHLDNGEQGKNVLPGFQQAFGSTEIGRFSRNDFFTNPPPSSEATPDKTLLAISIDHPWNPNPSQTNFSSSTVDVDYFNAFCEMDEGYLAHPQRRISGENEKEIKEEKIEIEETIKEEEDNCNNLELKSEPLYKSDEFLDALSTVIGDIGDFNVDELLKVESEKYNFNELNMDKKRSNLSISLSTDSSSKL